MTTTHASHSAPKPVEAAHKNNPSQARTEGNKSTDVPADLFAAMLALMSDGPATTDGSLVETVTKDADAKVDATDVDPLAAMLAWMAPAQAAAGSDTLGRAAADTGDHTRNAVRDTSATVAEGMRKEGIDITGMTRVDEAAPALPNAAAQARAAVASRPAFSPLNPNAAANAVTASARTADGQTANNAQPAMVWQRGATSTTDALQQQQATQVAQVRSTVALNERFGLAGAPLETSSVAQPQSEFNTTTGVGRSTMAGPAAGNDGGTAGLVGAGSSGDAGNGNGHGEHATDTQTSDGQPPVEHVRRRLLLRGAVLGPVAGGAAAVAALLAAAPPLHEV